MLGKRDRLRAVFSLWYRVQMNKQKLILVISIVLGCAIAFGAYALLRDGKGISDEPVIPLPERVASSTVTYRTYTSPTAGVSFFVPADWKTVGTTTRIESPDFVEEDMEDATKRVTQGAAISLEKEEFIINDSEEYASLISDFHDDPTCANCLTGHRITIGGVPAHLGFASVGTSTDPNGAIISFVSGGNRYRLLMSFAEYTPLNQEVLAELIYTFKLLP